MSTSDMAGLLDRAKVIEPTLIGPTALAFCCAERSPPNCTVGDVDDVVGEVTGSLDDKEVAVRADSLTREYRFHETLELQL